MERGASIMSELNNQNKMIIPPQETFDKIVNGLRNQGEPAKKEGRGCCYRIEEDGCVLKCAAGQLISDDEYNEKFEGFSVSDKDNPEKNDYSLVGEFLYKKGHYLPLVRALQEVHDEHSVDSWEDLFEEVAKRFGLIYTEPCNCPSVKE